MQQSNKLILAAATMAILWPSAASAKISKELRAELTEHIERHDKSEDVEARRASILTRALLDGKKSVKALEPLLEDPDARIRLAASVALIEAGDRKAASSLYKELDETTDVLGTLQKTVSLLKDKSEAKIIEGYLKKAAPERAAEVFRYLAAQDGALFKILEKRARAKNKEDRATATRALASIPRKRALPVIKGLLSSKKDKNMRMDGVQLAIALHPYDEDSAALATLIKGALTDADQTVALAAALELTSRDVVSGVRALTRIAAAQEEAPRKLELLRLVNQAAVRGVAIDKASAALFKALEDRGDLAVEIARLHALSGDNALLEKNVALFTDFSDYEGRLFAARVLGYSRSRAAVAELSKGMFEGSPQMRRLSAEGLAVAALPDALPALKKALQRERDEQVLMWSVKAVGRIKSDESMQALRLLVTRANKDLKPILIQAFIDQDDPAGVASLKLIKRDLDESIRWSASLAILRLDLEAGQAALNDFSKGAPAGFIVDVAALPIAARKKALVVILDRSSPSSRASVLSHMINRPGVYKATLNQLLTSPKTSEQERARLLHVVNSLNGTKDSSAIAGLARSKSNSLALRQDAAWTLVRYPTKDMEATLRGYLVADEPSLQAIGMYGLASLND